ncbi:carnitine O-palmitoyltransferase 1, liver isoform-like [Oppia nitens]|uniref:carnitine O-palmitoyltransferase 1, liver isoform-like n=1 Tax=Oppia nitens TaxID=1686743 RepID=UPI0023D9C33B|nr:carnitine O-palmitoyltransferase 1, liver isoform-like [Oppia nitens]
MAEAHSAVAFSFQVTHDGLRINYDVRLLQEVWQSGVRSWRRRIARFNNNLSAGVFPSSVEFLLFICSAVLFSDLVLAIDPSFGAISLLIRVLECLLPPTFVRLFALILFSVFLWIAKALSLRYALKCLLIYKKWIFESRVKKPSLLTRLWMVGLRLLTLKKPRLYSFQASLPRLPLPPLEQTICRYLESVRPLQSDSQFAETTRLARDFGRGVGRRFQRYLWLKAWWASNYVSDWWEEFVYLRGRAPLVVNSNFYGIDSLVSCLPTQKPSARAANLVYSALVFRKLVDRQELAPILLQKAVPLCSSQYERIFNTTRIPNKNVDFVLHSRDSPHIVVLSSGKFFKLQIHRKGRLLPPRDLQTLFQRIIQDDSPVTPEESRLAALTASDRDCWAETRLKHFSRGLNRVSLSAIEKSAFVVVLDDESHDFQTSQQLDAWAAALLHGKANDRWFDKSFQLIVAKNARVGFNGEHSWADAPILAHLWEFILHHDFRVLQYDSNGDCRLGHSHANDASPPIRLQWDLTPPLCLAIDLAFKSAVSVVKDVDLRLFSHKEFGKRFIKRCHVSPDAFIQMALQLAYRRDQGHLSLTYEASMTRLFREGRTETVRPITNQSKRFIDQMLSSEVCDKNQSKELLLKACLNHQRLYQEAMCGGGVDRHLFCLYVISRYLSVDSPFLSSVLSEPWRLSTSQTPHGQVGLVDADFVSAGGGFGPVADDGYGVSYIIAGEDNIFFHVSSKISCKTTDSKRFSKNIEKALKDIQNIFI